MDAIKMAIKDVETLNGIKTATKKGHISRMITGSASVFELTDIDGTIFKSDLANVDTGAVAGNETFVDRRIKDDEISIQEIKIDGLNCLVVPKASKIGVDTNKDGTDDFWVLAVQKYDVPSDLATRDRYETFYSKSVSDPKLDAGLREMFRQDAIFQCKTGFFDTHVGNIIPSVNGDELIYIDLDFSRRIAEYGSFPPSKRNINPRLSAAAEGLYNLFANRQAGKNVYDQRYRQIGLPHAAYYPEIYQTMSKCFAAESKPLTDTWFRAKAINKTVFDWLKFDSTTVPVLQAHREKQYNSIKDFKFWLTSKGIALDSKVNLVANYTGTDSKTKIYVQYFENTINKKIAGGQSTSDPLWATRIEWLDIPASDKPTALCPKIKSGFEELKTKGAIYDYFCDDTLEYMEVRY